MTAMMSSCLQQFDANVFMNDNNNDTTIKSRNFMIENSICDNIRPGYSELLNDSRANFHDINMKNEFLASISNNFAVDSFDKCTSKSHLPELFTRGIGSGVEDSCKMMNQNNFWSSSMPQLMAAAVGGHYPSFPVSSVIAGTDQKHLPPSIDIDLHSDQLIADSHQNCMSLPHTFPNANNNSSLSSFNTFAIGLYSGYPNQMTNIDEIGEDKFEMDCAIRSDQKYNETENNGNPRSDGGTQQIWPWMTVVGR